MADHSTTVLEAQVDWLTCSYRGDKKSRSLASFAIDCENIEAERGDKRQKFGLNGYEGWRTGRVRWGAKDNATLIQLSGQLADDYAGSLIPDATTITRLDLQVTARPNPPNIDYGQQALRELTSWYLDHPLSAVPSHTSDANGGWTTYVGARRSPTFARLYNKGAECIGRSDGPGYQRYRDAWRWELECHDAFASSLAVGVAGVGDRAAFIQNYVHDYFSRRGHRCLFAPGSDPVYRAGSSRRSDRQTRLHWLSHSVAPAVRELLGQPNPQEVIDALGLGPSPS